MSEIRIYDLVIIGAGPAGLAASIYASRYKLEHLIFGAETGGQLNEIHEIENWPGEIRISGVELSRKFHNHMENYGVKINRESVAGIKKNDDKNFELTTSYGKYLTRSIVFAMGAKYKKMNIPGEKEFIGKGVSYCATCDAMFFREKNVCVIGGGNSAAVVALELRDFAKKVYLIYRDEKLLAEPIWLDRIIADEKIEMISENSVIEIKGDAKVEKIVLDKPYNDHTTIPMNGVFIEVGTEPGVSLAKNIGVDVDENNYIKVGSDQGTNIKGIFAAGDITDGSNKFRQVITAASEGAIAANGVYKLLKLK